MLEARRRARVRRARRLGVAVLMIGLAALGWLAGSGGRGAVLAESSSRPFVNVGAFARAGELAFVSRGRLWVLDGRPGTLRAVSPAGEQASAPEFSPNGRWLSYTLAGSEPTAARVWVAHANGSSPRPVAVAAGNAQDWLPHGELLAGGAVWRVDRRGIAHRVRPAPPGLIAWSPQGGRYAFARWGRPATQQGVLAVSVAASLTGPRTAWFVAPKPSRSVGGTLFIHDALVLPGTGSIILHAETYCCDWADGLEIDELSGPGAKLVRLGSNVDDVMSVARSGTFAFTDGLDRYAWSTKRGVICSPARETCIVLRTPRGVLSLDPALAPDGRTVAFVKARGSDQSEIGQAATEAWYRTHTLWLQRPGQASIEVPGSGGASTPAWSADGHSLLYVAGDGLWLLASTSSRPVRIAAPLFDPSSWNSFYGEVDWTSQFAWASP